LEKESIWSKVDRDGGDKIEFDGGWACGKE